MDPNSLDILFPHFYQSHGLVEHSIQTVKRTLKKTKLADNNHYLSMLFLNSQPDKNGLSTSHKLFNRPIRINLLSLNHNLNLLSPKQQLNQKPRIVYRP